MPRNPKRLPYPLWRMLDQRFLIALLFSCFAVFDLSGMAAQNTPGTSRKGSQEKERRRKEPPNLEYRANPDAKDENQEGKPFQFGVEVDLVILPTTVVDKDGNFISGLKQEDFTVFENKVQQPLTYFGQIDLPITIGLVMDTSGSMRTKLPLVNQAAMQFLKLSNPNDETFLISFNHEVNLVEDFTDDLDTIREALDNITVTGGTALYDAILLGTQKAQKGSRQKQALLIISDGEDRDSYYRLEEVLRIIQESNVQAYVVGFLTPEPEEGLFDVFSKNPQEKAKNALTRIAQETGAKAVFPKDISQLPAIMKSIAHELRNQYHLGYIPTNTALDGSWRAVQITLSNPANKSYRVRTRSGYYAKKAAPAKRPG
jgi:Ca-activated chloride channel homolog